MKLPRSTWGRLLLVLPAFAATIALLVWRGPEWGLVADAFRLVAWEWIVAAVALNLLSVLARAGAWHRVIEQAMPPPRPPFRMVFSAFSIGLFANAVLPGRIGELARVAVLTRHQERRADAWATLVGTVFAHRLFDLVPATILVVWVLLTAEVPHWAVVSFGIAAFVGFALFTVAWLGAKRHERPVVSEGMGTIRQLLSMGRQGLSVLKAPVPLAGAVLLQCLGWLMQLLAVYAAM